MLCVYLAQRFHRSGWSDATVHMQDLQHQMWLVLVHWDVFYFRFFFTFSECNLLNLWVKLFV